jgi:hypothetical protein
MLGEAGRNVATAVASVVPFPMMKTDRIRTDAADKYTDNFSFLGLNSRIEYGYSCRIVIFIIFGS